MEKKKDHSLIILSLLLVFSLTLFFMTYNKANETEQVLLENCIVDGKELIGVSCWAEESLQNEWFVFVNITSALILFVSVLGLGLEIINSKRQIK